MADEQTVAPSPVNIEKRIGQYIMVRDAMERLEEKQKVERRPLQQMLDQLGGVLQKFLDENNLESLRTDAGSCYTSVRHTASVQDPDAFMTFVKETQNFDLLERRANATAVRDYVKDHGHLPTGVNLNAISSVGVRRPTKKKD